MVKRRDLLSGGILGGLMGVFGAGPSARADGHRADAGEPAAAQRQQSREDFKEIVDALEKVRQEIADQRAFPEIGPIREAQRLFLRSNQKMPDFIEVGAAHWFRLYDWHVRWQ